MQKSLLIGLSLAWMVGAALWLSYRSNTAPESATVGIGSSDAPRPSYPTRFTGPESRADASGWVLDPESQPIEGARVCAQLFDGSGNPVCTRTAPSGRFAFSELLPGRWLLAAAAPGHLPISGEQALMVTLVPGQVRDELRLVLEPGGATVSGQVLDATGGVVPGARVRAGDPARTGRASGIAGVETEADDNGRFTLHVASGPVRVTAIAAGYAAASRVTRAPKNDLKLVLTPAGAIEGVVRRADTREGVAGATVWAVRVGAHWEPGALSAYSGPDGTFSIGGVEAAAYSLLAVAEHARGRLAGPIEVRVAETVTGQTVEVGSAASVTGRVVHAQTGEPCERGAVVLGVPFAGAALKPLANASIGRNGSVQFPGVAPGEYAVRVDCFGHYLAAGPRSILVTEGDVDGLRWDVARGSRLTVQVLDGSSAPVGGVTGTVQPATNSLEQQIWSFVTAEDGTDSVPAALAPGRYTVSTTGSLRAPPVSVEVTGGEAHAVLRVEAAGSVRVTVCDTEGAPVEEVSVTLVSGPPAPVEVPVAGLPPERSPEPWRPSERAGQPAGVGVYRVSALAPGNYEVVVADGVNAPRRVAVVVDAGEVDVKVTLERGEPLEGDVLDEAGGPVPNVWVSAVATPNAGRSGRLVARASPQRVLTDLDGRFTLAGLLRGATYTVSAEQTFGATAVLRGVSVSQHVSLTLPGLGAVAGVAFREDGQAVAGATVVARHGESGTSRLTNTASDGSWTIERIPAGWVDISLSTEDGASMPERVRVQADATRDGVRLLLRDQAQVEAELEALARAAE